MKGRYDHKVPLSPRAVDLLKALPRRGELVFAGAGGKPLSDTALLKQLRRSGPGTTTHGFRSLFRTGQPSKPISHTDIAEAALAHKVPDAVVRAYRRTDFFERRRKLMEAWASYCSRPASTGATVTPLRKVSSSCVTQ